MTVRENEQRSAAALSSLIATLQAHPSTAVDVSEQYSYRVVWSPDEQAFRGTVDEMPALCWLAGEHIAALAGIRNRAREAVAEAVAGGRPPPEAFGSLGATRDPAGAERPGLAEVVPVLVPVELYARLAASAREQQVEPHLLAISRLAGSREVAILELSEPDDTRRHRGTRRGHGNARGGSAQLAE
ncbi:hypothetical protein ASC66_06575 [Leifsonia sp. Root4]|uniref:hypothetical protein n=1 Tax=Leifsonia sp. Root4 TaxID=1736525 RepID=UPI0006FC94E2|nr:hypothetical protein [Leifsonia sp. Root4]KQW06190.1 hypothetical protein ASC66_06575 [Leifsonia sp. Root4]